MKGKIKKTFTMGNKIYEVGLECDFTEEQINRLPDYIEPIVDTIKSVNSPPIDKMIKEPEVNKKTLKKERKQR